jgi:hypothetical protein
VSRRKRGEMLSHTLSLSLALSLSRTHTHTHTHTQRALTDVHSLKKKRKKKERIHTGTHNAYTVTPHHASTLCASTSKARYRVERAFSNESSSDCASETRLSIVSSSAAEVVTLARICFTSLRCWISCDFCTGTVSRAPSCVRVGCARPNTVSDMIERDLSESMCDVCVCVCVCECMCVCV